MNKKLVIVIIFALLYATMLLLPRSGVSPMPALAKGEPSSPKVSPSLPTFRSVDPKYEKPSWWTLPEFKLSQDFPTVEPGPCPISECGWKKYDPKTRPREYMLEVLKYAYKGNLENDWRQSDVDPQWFHAPWMHYTDKGREFIHGMTKERTACNDELYGKLCGNNPITFNDKYFDSWAVSLYDTRGAFYIRKIWEEMSKPNPDPAKFPPAGFPEGSVSIKLLFTSASKAKGVNYLENSVEWWADTKRARQLAPAVREACKTDLSKCLEKMYLLQIDVAVKVAPAISPTGWVFGTFTYNNKAEKIFDYIDPSMSSFSTEQVKEIEKWLRVEPLGLMYGNALDETRLLFTQTPQHLGCDRRLNGPVDNPSSSCISCHSAAETRRDLDFVRLLGLQGMVACDNRNSDKYSRWFRNINLLSSDPKLKTFIESRTGDEIYSFDYSLQLQKGVQRCCQAQKDNATNPANEIDEPNACQCANAEMLLKRPKTNLEMTRDGVEVLVSQ